MADKNMKRISDEELENVAGGIHPAFGFKKKRRKKEVEQLTQEALVSGKIDPSDPSTIIQAVRDTLSNNNSN